MRSVPYDVLFFSSLAISHKKQQYFVMTDERSCEEQQCLSCIDSTFKFFTKKSADIFVRFLLINRESKRN